MLQADFKYLLRQKILTICGSLHSELLRRTKGQVSTPSFILDQPNLVQQVQREFCRAGANILVTGTGSANRLLLEKEHLGHRQADINREAVKLSREAMTPDCLLFGSLGSTGALLKPYGRLSENDYREIFQQQAGLLMEAGVDGFILEGFSSLIEAEHCLLGLREICALPIIATMTLMENGSTKFGDTIDECFATLHRSGADVVGIHGTLGPQEIDAFLADLKKPFPLCVRPNAGYPVRIGNIRTFLSSPEYVAECAEQFIERGAVIIGGAAGFTPDHIREVARRLKGKRPVTSRPQPSSRITRSGDDRDRSEKGEREVSDRLSRKLGIDPIVSVELEPPQGLEVDGIISLLRRLKPHGIDAVNIPENPLARARVSSIALAKVIAEQTGLESIAHITCRDRNLISLQAELLGAHMLGVRTVLALTGDPSGVSDYPTATHIFDVDSLGLVEIMARMNIGKDFGMNDLGAATNFNIGVAANPLPEDLKTELNRLETKIKRGANFIQTQPVFDPARIQKFMRAVESFNIPVILGIMLVRDYRHAKFLTNEYPGIHIRDEDLELFRKGDERAQAQLGIDLAVRLMRELGTLSGGVYLMPSFGEAERLVQVFEQLEQKGAPVATDPLPEED